MGLNPEELLSGDPTQETGLKRRAIRTFEPDHGLALRGKEHCGNREPRPGQMLHHAVLEIEDLRVRSGPCDFQHRSPAGGRVPKEKILIPIGGKGNGFRHRHTEAISGDRQGLVR
jgi:hypothetical protein